MKRDNKFLLLIGIYAFIFAAFAGCFSSCTQADVCTIESHMTFEEVTESYYTAREYNTVTSNVSFLDDLLRKCNSEKQSCVFEAEQLQTEVFMLLKVQFAMVDELKSLNPQFDYERFIEEALSPSSVAGQHRQHGSQRRN